jgi:hypothetical protein
LFAKEKQEQRYSDPKARNGEKIIGQKKNLPKRNKIRLKNTIDNTKRM